VRYFRTSGLLARRGAAGVRLFTCNGYDWTERFPLTDERSQKQAAPE
jgi:ATP-dependent DNA ligase